MDKDFKNNVLLVCDVEEFILVKFDRNEVFLVENNFLK